MKFETMAFKNLISTLTKGMNIRVQESSNATEPILLGNTLTIPTVHQMNLEYIEQEVHRLLGRYYPSNSCVEDIRDTGDQVEGIALALFREHRSQSEGYGTYSGRDRVLDKGYQERIQELPPIPEPIIEGLVTAMNSRRNEWSSSYNHREETEFSRELGKRNFVERLEKATEVREVEGLLKELKVIDEELKEEQQEQEGTKESTEDNNTEDRATEGAKDEQEQTSDGEGEPRDDTSEDSEASKQAGEDSEGDQSSDETDAEGNAGGDIDGEQEGAEDGHGEPETENGVAGGTGEVPGEEGKEYEGQGDTEGETGEHSGRNPGEVLLLDPSSLENLNKFMYDKGTEKGATSNQELGSKGKPPEGIYVPTNAPDKVYHMDSQEALKYRIDPYRYSKIINITSGLILSRSIRKYLMCMKQSGYTYGQLSGKLHGKSLYKTKFQTNPRLFKRKMSSRIEEDSAISILLDCSGSMAGGKYCTAAACCVALGELLESIGTPYEIIGFSDDYVNTTKYFIFKDFSKKVSSRENMVARFSSELVGLCGNEDSQALSFAMERLQQRSEKSKSLIVLSDGEPTGCGEGDPEEALRETCRYIEESTGVNLCGIGILTDCVEEYYSNSYVLKDVDSLEECLVTLIKEQVIK